MAPVQRNALSVSPAVARVSRLGYVGLTVKEFV